jgi:hypothetical protein
MWHERLRRLMTWRHVALQKGDCYVSGVITTPYAAELAGQMNRYLSSRFGWTSILFRLSTPGLLRELLLAGNQVAEGVLSSSSFEELRSQVTRQFYQDPGLGDTTTRNLLGAMLPKNADEFRIVSHKHRALSSSVSTIADNYLDNWRVEFAKPVYSAIKPFGDVQAPDVAAAFLATYLLELGINSNYLVKWLDYRLISTDCSLDLIGFVDELVDLRTSGYGTLEVMVVADKTAAPDARPQSGWLEPQQVREWLEANDFITPQTMHGGILFSSDQWEIYSALEAVGSALRKMSRRAFLKTGKTLSFYGNAWIKGVERPKKIPNAAPTYTLLPGYEFEAPSLVAPSSNNRLEVAVEFIEAAATVEGPSAVGMLWAALETLLSAPGDPNKMEVVKRGADIGLIAFIRSTIWNSLGTAMNKRTDSLAKALAAIEPANRLDRFEAALRTAEYESLSRVGSRIHLRHVARLLDQGYVKEIRTTFQHVLAGLYRQRNLVLHGGVTDGPLIEGYLRCGYPLAAAIVNRYARASESSYIDPQVFAFRSTSSIEEYLQRGLSVFTFLN